MKSAAPNPFQPAPGASPPFLAGREAELAAIEDATLRTAARTPAAPLTFLGLRGLGKTVLLNEVRSRTAQAVHLRLEIEPGFSLETALSEAIQRLRASTDPPIKKLGRAFDSALRYLPMPSIEVPHVGSIALVNPSGEKPEELPLGLAIDALNDEVAKLRRSLVITIDEIQDVDVVGFRSLIARVHQSADSGAPILLACAGLPKAFDLFAALRTYTSRWDRFTLDFLTHAETVEAIREPVEEHGVKISFPALDRLAEESAGYPFFIQKYAAVTWNRKSGRTIDLDDVENAIASARPILERTFYADAFAALTPRERHFAGALATLGPGSHAIRRVAEAYGAKTSSAIGSLRDGLIRKGVIYSPAVGKLQFRMPLAERYVAQRPADFLDANREVPVK